MLSDESIQLITAYVDGELTSRQRDEVMRLLNKSAEARELLKQLLENVHKLKKLPSRKVQPSLVDEIVQAIEAQKTRVQPPTRSKRRRSWAPAVLLTMAASLLVAALGILGWIALNNDEKNPFVVNNDRKTDVKPEPKPGPEQPPIEVTPKKSNPLLAKMVEGTFKDFGSPLPPDRELNASFAELKKGGKRVADFVHDVNLEKSVQLDVVVKKNSEAMARLRSVLKGQGIKLVEDPTTAKAVDDKKTEYLIYADNLTSGELAKLMNELGDSYVVPFGMNQKSMTSPYQKLKLTPFADEAKNDLAKQLGVNPEALNRKEGKAEIKVERAVVLMPGGAAASPSKEVRQFVNQRREAPPGAVQVLIKIRQE
jgi:hypothetical protein